MVSVVQIFDPQITFKTGQEVQKFRKALTKNNDGSLKFWYEKKALGEGISKQVSNHKMDKVLDVFCAIKTLDFESLKGGSGGFQWRVYRCVYFADERNKITKSLYIYALLIHMYGGGASWSLTKMPPIHNTVKVGGATSVFTKLPSIRDSIEAQL